MASDAALPRDPDVLLGMVAELREENDRLRAMLATLKRMVFGARSERRGADSDSGQLPLGLDDVSMVPSEPAPETASRPVRREAPARPKPARNIGALPNHLPREDVVIEPATSECPCCRGKLHRIGEGSRDRGRRLRKPENARCSTLCRRSSG
jgi:hypothetical protein